MVMNAPSAQLKREYMDQQRPTSEADAASGRMKYFYIKS